ncbi:hypothetical protein [Methylobacterium oxalidis]|uniref:hypothetical protein n=1 Tax=Methylobacterium oxalidis TaxID=944322 RepID=UPI003314FCD0
MPKSNFLHLECASRAEGRAQFVLDELARRPGACQHVPDPQPPIQVAGLPWAEMPNRIAALLEQAREVTRAGVKKRVRTSQSILLTGVASYPALMSEVAANPEEWTAYERWRELAAGFFMALAETQAALCSVVAHHDESHPHLHAVIIPTDPGMLAKGLHPGYAARSAETEACMRAGMAKGEASRNGKRAFGRAMRELQDSYHDAVGRPCGHSRLLTGRARLPRAEYLALRACHDARDAALRDRDRAERERAEIVAEAERIGYARARRAAEAAVAAEVADLHAQLREAERQVAILHAAWREESGRVAELEAQRAQIEDLLSAADDASGYRW